jgi:hypothetical protein
MKVKPYLKLNQWSFKKILLVHGVIFMALISNQLNSLANDGSNQCSANEIKVNGKCRPMPPSYGTRKIY